MRFSVWRTLGLPVLVPAAAAHGSEGAATVVLAFAALDLGASPGTAALVVGLLGVGRLAGSVPAGRAVTRLGDRRVLLASLAMSTTVWLCALAARTVGELGVVALVGGLCSSGFAVARQARAIELTPAAHRGRAMAALGGSGRVGLVTGPVIVGLVQPWVGVRAGFLVCVLLALIAAATVLVTVREPSHSTQPAAEAKPGGETVRAVAARHAGALRSVGAGVMVLAGARATRTIVVPLAAHRVGISPGAAAILVGVSAAAELALVYPAGIAMDRLGRRWVATPCLTIMGIGLLVLSCAPGPGSVVLGALTLAAGSGLGSGIVKTLGADLAPISDRGTFLGLWTLLAETGSAAWPLGVGGLLAVVSFGTSVGTLGVACLGGAVWLDHAIRIHVAADASGDRVRGGPRTGANA